MINHPKWKDPVLEPEEVTRPVVDQVFKGRSGQLILPKSISIASGLRGFPHWLQESVRKQQADTLAMVDEAVAEREAHDRKIIEGGKN